MTKLSTAAHAVLTAAAARADHVALAPERLPAAARRAVVQSMLKAGLIEEVAADDDQPAWRTTDAGERFGLRITDAGLQAVGAEPADSAHEPAQGGPQEAETASAAPHAPEQADAAQDARPRPGSGPLHARRSSPTERTGGQDLRCETTSSRVPATVTE